MNMKVKLGEVSVLINGDRGKNYPSQADILSDGDIPFVNAGHLDGRSIRLDEMSYITIEKYNQLSSGKFRKGDILYCLRGSLGKKAVVQEIVEGAIASSLVIIRPDSQIIDVNYLMLALDSPCIQNQLLKANNGSSQPNLSAASVRAYEIDLPNKKVQEEIVNKFDKIQRVIDARKQQLQKLDELVKSRFVEMFGDADLAQTRPEWRSVSEIGTVVGGATPKTTNDEFWDGLYRWITPAELENESGYIFDSVRKITEAGVKSCALTELPVGTVILSSRAPIGKVAIAGNTFYCNQGFKNIICNQDINPVFLYSLLRMNTRYLNSLGRGATFKEISKAIVENIRIPVPPRMHQDRFAAFVAEVDKSKLAVQQSLEKLETLKKSLMQQYFG